MVRRLAIFALAVVVASACGRYVRHTETAATPEGTESVGEAFRTFEPAASEEATPAEETPRATPRSALVVTVTDQNGGHPAGIPVRFSRAGMQRTVVTDSDGRARIAGPGVFRIDVVQGCHARVRVTGGGFATVGAPPEGDKPVELPVRWQHRFAPAPPIQPGRSGAWPVGANTSLRFSVNDRCALERAPGASYSSFRFETNSVVEMVGEPKLEADDEGRGSVTVRCVRDGVPSVVAVDAKNPSDSLDLIEESVGFSEPRCRAN